jgi:hypothetical protein
MRFTASPHLGKDKTDSWQLRLRELLDRFQDEIDPDVQAMGSHAHESKAASQSLTFWGSIPVFLIMATSAAYVQVCESKVQDIADVCIHVRIFKLPLLPTITWTALWHSGLHKSWKLNKPHATSQR